MVACKNCGEEFERRKGYSNFCKATCKGTNKGIQVNWALINSKKEKLLKHTQTCNDKAEKSFFQGDKLNIDTIRKLLMRKVNYTCEYCKGAMWMGKKIPLEIHHVDGNNKNNKHENLHIICPNCHSQTDNFRAKNIKKKNI